MTIIPNLELTEEQVHGILTRNRLFSGGEATICETDNPYSLYKIFTERGKAIPMGFNKEKKIELIYEMQPENSVKPLRTISLNDVIIGYEVSSDYDLEAYKLYQLSDEELLYFLKETKRILEYFSSKGIIYGDIEPRNILFNRNTGEIQFCDIDNIQIGNYPIDKMPYNLMDYDIIRGIDNGVHPYMHNHMTLRAFDLDLYYSTNYSIRQIFKRPAKKIITSMKDVQSFNNEYLISHRTKE